MRRVADIDRSSGEVQLQSYQLVASTLVVDLIDGGISERIYRQESDQPRRILRDLCCRKLVLAPDPSRKFAGLHMQRRQTKQIGTGQNHSLRNVSLVERAHGISREDRGRLVGWKTLSYQRAQLGRRQVHVMVGAPFACN